MHSDIAYGDNSAQKLDVYQGSKAKDAPIIIMVHGGGWHRGDKADTNVVKNKVAHYLPLGYDVISVNYRLSPQVTPVTEASDVAAALAYVQKHATEWAGSASKIVMMGHSAGANLVALVAANPTFAAKASAAPWLGTVVLDSAAYNVVQIMQAKHLALYDPVFGTDQELWQQSSPTLVLGGKPAPMLLVCSTNRADSCPQAKAFSIAADALGTSTSVDPVPLSHGQINAQVGAPGPLTNSIDALLRSLKMP
ncbi:MAG: alpha/beta hydrolase [Antricoccus sp.]